MDAPISTAPTDAVPFTGLERLGRAVRSAGAERHHRPRPVAQHDRVAAGRDRSAAETFRRPGPESGSRRLLGRRLRAAPARVARDRAAAADCALYALQAESAQEEA